MSDRRLKTGPSKTVAANFLRTIARDVGLPIENRAQRAADLTSIADCIEGKARWRRPETKSPFDEQQQINLAAWAVEHRPAAVKVKAALSDAVTALAKKLGRETEADKRKLRAYVVAARNRLRKMEK